MKRTLILGISLSFCAYFAPHGIVRRSFSPKVKELFDILGRPIYSVMNPGGAVCRNWCGMVARPDP